MAKVLFQDLNGGVSIIVPTNYTGQPSTYAWTLIPDDAARTFIDHDFMLPVDYYFRPAWTWDGESRFVVEDLEKSKSLATAAVKSTALQQAKKDLSLKRMRLLAQEMDDTTRAAELDDIDSELTETYELLGKLHNQKVFWRPKPGAPYIGG